MSGLTLDAGALIAFEHGKRRALLLFREAHRRATTLSVPATALAQVLRNPSRQASLMRLIRQPLTEVVPLDRVHASFVGQLLAKSGTTDIADAHVVIVAKERAHRIVTTDPRDLDHLGAGQDLVVL